MKRLKRLLTYGGLFMTLTLLLSACTTTQTHQKPPTGFFYGSIYHFLGLPMKHLITWIANLFGNPPNYGWAILLITLIVRLILMPLMLNQSKKTITQQHKREAIQPQLTDIQERQSKATSPEEKAELTQEMMTVMRENGVSMTGGMGCLPLLIQLPIFSALYMAIRYSSEIFKSTFLGISLGHTNLIVAILAGLTYVLQGYLSLVGLPESQKKQMKTMMMMSPLMTFFIAMVSPAGLGLYFFAGGILAIVQTLITNFYYMPRIKAEVAADLKKNPPKQVVKPAPKKPVAPKPAKPQRPAVQPHRNRNAGKQRRS